MLLVRLEMDLSFHFASSRRLSGVRFAKISATSLSSPASTNCSTLLSPMPSMSRARFDAKCLMLSFN